MCSIIHVLHPEAAQNLVFSLNLTPRLYSPFTGTWSDSGWWTVVLLLYNIRRIIPSFSTLAPADLLLLDSVQILVLIFRSVRGTGQTPQPQPHHGLWSFCHPITKRTLLWSESTVDWTEITDQLPTTRPTWRTCLSRPTYRIHKSVFWNFVPMVSGGQDSLHGNKHKYVVMIMEL